MESAPTCPDCDVSMEMGFVPDHYAQIIQSHWHPGTATEKTFMGNLKLDKGSMIPITVFRCPECGELRHFAIR